MRKREKKAKMVTNTNDALKLGQKSASACS